jgi:hypothetical protein
MGRRGVRWARNVHEGLISKGFSPIFFVCAYTLQEVLNDLMVKLSNLRY